MPKLIDFDMPTLGAQEPVQWPEMQGPTQQPTLGSQQPINFSSPTSPQGPMPLQPQLGNQRPRDLSVPDIFGSQGPMPQQPQLGNQQPIGGDPSYGARMRGDIANQLGAMGEYQAPSGVPSTPWNEFNNGMRTSELQSQGQVRAPEGVAEAVADKMKKPEDKGYESRYGAPEGYTDEEKRRYDQEINIAGAKKGIKERIAAKEIAKSLEEQGLSRDEINKAIGGDTAETLSNLKAMQAGRTASATGKGVDKRVRDQAVQKARYEDDGTTPKNAEARAVGYMDWADKTGVDPQGKSNYDTMTKGERNQYDRAVKSLSRGTRDPNSERRLKDLVGRVDKKRERAYSKKQADLAEKTAQRAIDKAESDQEKAYYGNLRTRAEILKKEYDGRSSKPRKDEITAELKEINEAMAKGYQESEPTQQTPKGAIGVKRDSNGIPLEYYMNDGSIRRA